MRHLIFIFQVLLLLGGCTRQPEIAQWRGPNRDGWYPGTGLMKAWPKDGPELLWASDLVGDGYGSPVVTNDALFVTGAIDSTAYLFSFDLRGKLNWKVPYGEEWAQGFPGSRSAPTVVDDLVYVSSGKGDLACLDRKDGKKVWSVNLFTTLHGKNTIFGYSEGLLVKDQMIYCTPGGADTNVVALNRFSGDLIWKCKGVGQLSAFCSPKMLPHGKHNILLTFDNIMGGVVQVGNRLIATGHRYRELMSLDMETGKVLQQLKIGRGSTIYADSMIYLYDEKGIVHLVDPSSEDLREVSTFKIVRGTKEHFSHPVIGSGTLFIRHGRSLMAFNLRRA